MNAKFDEIGGPMFRSNFTLSPAKAVFAIAIAMCASWPVAAQAPGLSMLDGLTHGMWEIRDRDTQAKRSICVRSGREFIRLRHPGSKCNRTFVEGGAKEVTVQYSCPGKGYGRTNIRRESATLVQIEGQGISGTKNYRFDAEARRIGTCK